YRALDARSSQLAHHLRAHGVGPEVVVGLCLERSLEMLVGLIGILKAGGAYLPLDPDYPPERLAFMLADARAPLPVTHSTLPPRRAPHPPRAPPLPAPAPPTTPLEPQPKPPAPPPPPPPHPDLPPHTPAYVIYTSGSTGTPKGVAVTHQNVARLFTATEHLFR